MTGARSPTRWPPPTSAVTDPISPQCIVIRGADSNYPPTRSSAVASGPRLPVSPSTVQRVSGILGSAKDLASGDSVYTSRLSVKSQPWLSDHVIYGTVVVPGATYAAMALAAVGTPARVKDVFFYEPIILPEKSSREVQLTLHPADGSGGWSFQVHSRPYGDRDADWSLNAEGTVASGVDDELTPEQPDPVDAAIERMERMRPQDLFETFADMELAWGPNWSGSLKSLWLGEGEAIGDITVGEELAEQPRHRADAPGADGPVHRRRLPGVPGAAGARAGSQRSVPAVAVRAGVPAGEDAATVLLPRDGGTRATLDSETQVFDLDFVDRDGRLAGRDSRVHGQTRADGRRCCAGSAATPPGCCTPSAGMRCRRLHRTMMPQSPTAPG